MDKRSKVQSIPERIEEMARKAKARRVEEEATAPKPSIRKPPKGDEQPDLFVPTLYDVGTKDSQSIMDVAVYRLSKKDKRANAIIRYDLNDGYVQVTAGAAGMATVWDYDVVLMAVSQLTEAMNRYRKGQGEMPGRVFKPHVSDILKFCRRSDGGNQKDELVDTFLRLNTTHIAIERTKKTRNGKMVTESEGEPLISRYKITSNQAGKPEYVEIEIAAWMFKEIVDGEKPQVLTVHPDYFLIDKGIGRFVYRLARRAAGRSTAEWEFQTIFERSGSSGTFKEFSRILRGIIAAGDMPEYDLAETAGQRGPMLLMKYRGAGPMLDGSGV